MTKRSGAVLATGLLMLTLCAGARGQRIQKSSRAAADGGAAKTAEALTVSGGGASVNAEELTVSGTFAAKKLRAYGTVSGTSWRAADGGTLLQINCESEEKAKLAQAKYLSDLDALPPGTKPGTLTVSGVLVNIRDAGEQGVIAALQNGNIVVVAAAPSAAALGDLLGKTLTVSGWSSSASAKVPMWLDRFDKHGWHFYYGPGRAPLGANNREDPTYDPAQDFAFAERHHNAGLSIWTGAQYGHSAEWLINDVGWDWAFRSALKHGLPLDINLDLTSKTHFWVYNRDPLTMMHFAPDFQGSYYGSMRWGGESVSWCDMNAQDQLLGQLQQIIGKVGGVENVTAWLEPHGEMGHGPADYLVEFGPKTDKSYQEYLQKTHGSLSAVSQRWGKNFRSWDEVKVPEVAEFFGWGPDARDLRGEWRASYEHADDEAALTVGFDDSAWATISAPGHGLNRLAGTIAPKPILWRRHFDADRGWRSAQKKVWLYVWDMNNNIDAGRKKDQSLRVTVALNGKVLEEKIPFFDESHRAAFDVTNLLKDADNLLALRLPRGMMNYRIYLSGESPSAYPMLGAEKNAQWVDFYGWTHWLREQVLRRGMQMIRQADPNRGIILMSPDYYVAEIHQAAIDYGGDFRNTGYMAAWWCDRLAANMRAAGLPMTAEPGGGPPDALTLALYAGHWLTEGVNGVDLFQYMGEVQWVPEIRKNFEEWREVYMSVGRYHAETAHIAALYSGRVERILGFPWLAGAREQRNADDEPLYRGTAYVSAFNARYLFSPLGVGAFSAEQPYFESDAVSELSFQKNQCGKYRVIVDSSTSFMTELTVSGIERYVQNGGVFVTYGDSGRHTYEVPDSWPLARLTGFKPKAGKYFISGTASVSGGDERGFLPADLELGTLTGGHYQRVADDAQILAKWHDGSAAVGLRKIGRGYVVTVGPQFDRQRGNAFFASLFAWLNIAPTPARLTINDGNDKAVVWRHFVSNSGLYDVWVVFNASRDAALDATLKLSVTPSQPWLIDVKTGERRVLTDNTLPVKLPLMSVNVWLTPRTVSGAADEWFTLQRGWWSGGADADLGPPLPKPDPKFSQRITEGWKFKVIDFTQKTEPPAEVGLNVSDSDWETRAYDMFTHPDHPGALRGVFRREIEIPNNWVNGTVETRLSWCFGWMRVYLDGQPLEDRCWPIDVKPGEKHTLAVDVRSQWDRVLLGAREASWLAFYPHPAARQDLAGEWAPTGDYQSWRAPVAIPGTTEKNTLALRRVVKVSADARGRTVCIRGNRMTGVVINGHYLRPHTKEADVLTLNITPWVKVGADNEIVITLGGGPDKITTLSLDFHEPGTYP